MLSVPTAMVEEVQGQRTAQCACFSAESRHKWHTTPAVVLIPATKLIFQNLRLTKGLKMILIFMVLNIFLIMNIMLWNMPPQQSQLLCRK